MISICIPREFVEPVPSAISPEPILRGIRAKGYYIWRGGNANQPKGTSQ
jgi:hypothetical protein